MSKPSRTHDITIRSQALIAILAVFSLIGMWLVPEQFPELAKLFGTFGLAAAALGGGGSWAMAYRDGKSGGLTSSDGDKVLEARKLGNGDA